MPHPYSPSAPCSPNPLHWGLCPFLPCSDGVTTTACSTHSHSTPRDAQHSTLLCCFCHEGFTKELPNPVSSVCWVL